MSTTAICMNRVSFAYRDRPVLQGITLQIQKGEMVGIIGPNGSGKTTLLRLISGIINPGDGEVCVDGIESGRSKRSAIARQIAVVPQQFNMPFAYTVEEVVMLGRTPFMRPFRDFSARDREAVARTMETTGISYLGGRRFSELSGGERQKVILTMALAQEPKLLLLDEPTAHLDISHQVEILELLCEMNNRERLTIVAAMHDLNLASAYFGRLILLKSGQVIADGTPEEVLTPGLIAAVYSVPVHIQPHPLTGAPYVVVLPSNNGHT